MLQAVVALLPSRKTSSFQQPTASLPPSAYAQDGLFYPAPSVTASSPALSTTSTADGEDATSSPLLPSLPAPVLSERVRDILRTPPIGSAFPPYGFSDNENDSDGPEISGSPRQFVTSWGSPYPESQREQLRYDAGSYNSSSDLSESSEDEPIHRLDIQTPFLRPPPEFSRPSVDASILAEASILVSRARRPARSLTEDWIRQHTTRDHQTDSYLYLSDTDGTESGTATVSGHSSLRSSFSGGLRPTQLTENILDTPRPNRNRPLSRFLADQSQKSSIETLRAPQDNDSVIMTAEDASSHSPVGDAANEKPLPLVPDSADYATDASAPPSMQTKYRSLSIRENAPPRIRKKIPWKGKNIIFCLPRDDKRDQPGFGSMPLTAHQIERIYKEWEDLGYNTQGWALETPDHGHDVADAAQSRTDWPAPEDVISERQSVSYKVALPDLDAWAKYTAGLQEAKLRALGVLTAAEDPRPAPSPAPSLMAHRRISTMQHPGQVFSPPIPTSSAGSFGFPPPFNRGSMVHSPGLNSVPTPVSMGGHPGKYARQSISIPSAHSPFQMGHPSPNWAQQTMMMHGLQRVDSPLGFHGMASPSSPFQPTGSPAFNLHQRHQSMQYPMMTQQYHQPMQIPARGTPIMQEIVHEEEEEEEEEEAPVQELAKTESSHSQPPAQKPKPEDEEYHLEKQFMKDLEHADYNPNNDDVGSLTQQSVNAYVPPHNRQQSVQFSLPPTQFASNNTVLHHPRPHSRGHSLANNYYMGDKANDNSEENSLANQLHSLTETDSRHMNNDYADIETNPSAANTPAPAFNFEKHVTSHQHTFSTISNPWKDAPSANKHKPQSSHSSKASLSKLNVEAPEFKFNPTSTFTPIGGFNYGTALTTSNNETLPAPTAEVQNTPPKINPAAATFSPSQSEFNFSSFRPDAPAFTPFQPGSSSHAQGEHFTGSIFGSVDIPEDTSGAKKSKAIPIVSDEVQEEEDKGGEDGHVDADGRPKDDAPAKRARAFEFGEKNDEEDSVPLFAEPKDEPIAAVNAEDKSEAETETGATEKPEEDAATPALDTSMTLSSGVHSEQADTKPSSTNSPSVESIGQHAANWAPFDFDTKQEAPVVGEARPFDENWTPAPAKMTHKKSLSVTAKVFVPGTLSFKLESENEKSASESEEKTPVPENFPTETASEPIPIPIPAAVSSATRRMDTPPLPPPRGLMASRFASPPRSLQASRFASPSRNSVSSGDLEDDLEDGELLDDFEEDSEHVKTGLSAATVSGKDTLPSFQEIDDIMNHMNTVDPTMGVHRLAPRWNHGNTNRHMSLAAVTGTSAFDMQGHDSQDYRSSSQSPSRSNQLMYNDEGLENPFVDPPRSGTSFAGPIRCLNHDNDSEPNSDWDGTFAEDEEIKLAPRAAFFDGRVNQLVDHVLATRLQPLEKTLASIQGSLQATVSRHMSRRSRRSLSDDIQQSDADDEDEEPALSLSMSPRRDKRMDFIRSAVAEAISQQTNFMGQADGNSALMQAIQDIKMQIASPSRAITMGDEISKTTELETRVRELEQRLHMEETRTHKEITERRAAEDRAAELERSLQSVESRLETEMSIRAGSDARNADTVAKLAHESQRLSEEIALRRVAEDKAAENQRLLNASSHEEARLRLAVEEKEIKIRTLEQTSNNSAAQMQTKPVNTARLSALETEMDALRKEAQIWRSEAEGKNELVRRQEAQLQDARDEGTQLQRVLASLSAQMEENERIRESWRSKFISLQEDMSVATHKITEDTGRRVRREQALLARQEVLDAKLQAEARTRERLERELERLEGVERQGMRAINDNKHMEDVINKLRSENNKLQQAVVHHQREFAEARESGASEVHRTRMSLQNQLDQANNQVNFVRVELEEQMSALRAELDAVKMDADASKAQSEMLVEEANNNQAHIAREVSKKYSDEIEDLHTKYQHKISIISDEAQVREQQLLERLSLSTSKTEHLQDRIIHMEEKLDIAKQAAIAAAQSARGGAAAAAAAAAVTSSAAPIYAAAPAPAPKAAVAPAPRRDELPEKISPQALRESIMVLQEQLQAREHRIEELEEEVSKIDPEIESKITKRDDEIVWLRELLAVRHSDLQDIIAALSSDAYDRERVKDAVIRLQANLQMEEQERERALNGGSAIKLPRLAKTLTDAATPRMAQAVGPLAAAWGNWRKGQPAFASMMAATSSSLSTATSSLSTATTARSISSLSTANASATLPKQRATTPVPSATVTGPAPAAQITAATPTVTPAAATPPTTTGGGLLSGLLTPPTSGSRLLTTSNRVISTSGGSGRPMPLSATFSASSLSSASDEPQPTAFSSTGRRFTSGVLQPESMESRARATSTSTVRIHGSPPRTPPIMQASAYDSDAQSTSFDDHDFFED